MRKAKIQVLAKFRKTVGPLVDEISGLGYYTGMNSVSYNVHLILDEIQGSYGDYYHVAKSWVLAEDGDSMFIVNVGINLQIDTSLKTQYLDNNLI